MPKQKINHSTPATEGFGRFDLAVGWNRDMSVQVGIETPDEGGAGSGQRHLVDFLYADQQEAIGLALVLALAKAGRVITDVEYDSEHPERPIEATSDLTLGRMVLDAVTGSTVFGTSVWWHPDRHMINNLIRTLRKARDQAFGSDA